MSEGEKDAIQASFVSLGPAVIRTTGNLGVRKEDFHGINSNSLGFPKGYWEEKVFQARELCLQIADCVKMQLCSGRMAEIPEEVEISLREQEEGENFRGGSGSKALQQV